MYASMCVGMHMCLYVCTHVHVHVCTGVYACMCACMCVYACIVCRHVCMHVCVFVCVHVHVRVHGSADKARYQQTCCDLGPDKRPFVGLVVVGAKVNASWRRFQDYRWELRKYFG